MSGLLFIVFCIDMSSNSKFWLLCYSPVGGGLVAKSFPTLCDPMVCSLPCSSVHGILQARILEWVAIPFSRGSSRPRNRTLVSCIAGSLSTVLWGKPYLLLIPFIELTLDVSVKEYPFDSFLIQMLSREIAIFSCISSISFTIFFNILIIF